MGHNSVVSGHPKSIGIPRVDRLSTGHPDLGCHIYHFIHVNISYKHISTFTCNMSFHVQAMTHTQSSLVMATAHTSSSHVNTMEYSY